MRFSVPRSLSPSPVRRNIRSQRRSTFGLQPDSEDDNDGYSSNTNSSSDSDTDSESVASSSSSSSDSFCYASESEVPPPPPRPQRNTHSVAEQRYIEDTIAAIRLRTRHHDPYEEWERQTRKDAFRTARKEQHALQSKLHDEQERTRVENIKLLSSIHDRQMAEVQAQLQRIGIQQQRDEKRLQEGWNNRDKRRWERIEAVIKFEEDKVKARLEEERKRKEEEEKRRKNEELKRRMAEEKRKQEEEQRQLREEADRIEKEMAHKKEAEERLAAERLKAKEEEKKRAGVVTVNEDWSQARITLKNLKGGPMKNVKANKELKSAWSALRRQITPKIGQLTSDPKDVARISDQLCAIVHGHDHDMYHALLSALSKAILLQAETEVTAGKRSAMPLAQVTVNLLDKLEDFPSIFFAKLVQRTGGWPVPCVVPDSDVSGPWESPAARIKAMGYHRSTEGETSEAPGEYSVRVAGIMRVYFHILKYPVKKPLAPMFETQRCWIWIARMLGEAGLLETAVAPEVIYTALDVFGLEAKDIWGQQWIKVLALLYDGVTIGIGGDKFIGGQSPEGKAARVRVQLEVERIMNGIKS